MDTPRFDSEPSSYYPGPARNLLDYQVWLLNQEPVEATALGNPKTNHKAILNELATLDLFKENRYIGADYEEQITLSRNRIRELACSDKTAVRTRDLVIGHYLEAMDAPSGFHDSQDLADAIVISCHGATRLIQKRLQDQIERLLDTSTVAWLDYVNSSTPQEAITERVCSGLSQDFDWGKAK